MQTSSPGGTTVWSRLWRRFSWSPDRQNQETDPSRRAMRSQLDGIEWFVARYVLVIFIAVLFYALYACLQNGSAGAAVFVASLFSIVGIAGFIFGGLLGFLFGVPRFLQHSAEQAPKLTAPAGAPADAASADDRPSAPRTFAINTNLEEISDWLTKIIVGVGLTQATNIYDKVAEQASLVELKTSPYVVAGGGFYMAVLVASTLGGFLFFYLETRTRITLLLADADHATLPRVADKRTLDEAIETPIRSDNAVTSATNRAGSPDLTAADMRLLDVPFESLKTPEEFAAWAGAHARAGNLEAAARAMGSAITREPNNKKYLTMLADIRLRQGNVEGAVDIYSEASGKFGDDPVMQRQELLASLYLAPPKSFERALLAADRLMAADASAVVDPMVQLWLAAARGQQYAWLLRNNASEAESRKVRDRALEHVREVIRLAPDPTSEPRRLLVEMFDPSLGGAKIGNDDLYVFFNDAEFRDLILAGADGASKPAPSGPPPTAEPEGDEAAKGRLPPR